MRKVRDYDAELKALEDKARGLKARRIEQLGHLVTATGADTLDMEMLAGVLLDAATSQNTEAKEAWLAKGSAFFQKHRRKSGRAASSHRNSTGTQQGIDPAPGSSTTSN